MAEETSNVTLEDIRQEQAENSTFSFQAIYKALILNWYWFILSLIIFLGGAYIYLRYSTPTYQVQTKLLVKDDDSKNGGMSSSLANASASTLGLISIAHSGSPSGPRPEAVRQLPEERTRKEHDPV